MHRKSPFLGGERMCTLLEVEFTSRDNTEDRKQEDVIKPQATLTSNAKMKNTKASLSTQQVRHCLIFFPTKRILTTACKTSYYTQNKTVQTYQYFNIGPNPSPSFQKNNYMFGKSNKRQQTFPSPKPRVFSVESELENKINTNI